MFSLGGGLVTQLGPFHSGKQDHPNQPKGLGRNGKTRNTISYTRMAPSSFPMKYPMPSSVLRHNKYQSVVTIHDISKSINDTGRRALPPSQFNTPVQPVGQATLSSGTQKMGRGFTRDIGIQSQDVETINELHQDPQLHMQLPQEGNPIETYVLPGSFPQEPQLPPETGSGSVVVHMEEVSEQSLGDSGYLYRDSQDAHTIQTFERLNDNYESHNRDFINEYNHERREGKKRARADDDDDQYRTRHDINIRARHTLNFGDGSATEYVDEGGGDLTPFNFSGTLQTTGRRELLSPMETGDLVVPSRSSLIEQAFEFEDISPYSAEAFGFTSISRSQFTRPNSPLRRGEKRELESPTESKRKQHVSSHPYASSERKRKRANNTSVIGPKTKTRKVQLPQGTKRKNDLEHNLTKRYKTQ